MKIAQRCESIYPERGGKVDLITAAQQARGKLFEPSLSFAGVGQHFSGLDGILMRRCNHEKNGGENDGSS
jgi:hypothetical protein